ncbi:MAG: hypothetical protein ACYTXA_31610 [Nostoc sp.]
MINRVCTGVRSRDAINRVCTGVGSRDAINRVYTGVKESGEFKTSNFLLLTPDF